MDSLTEYYKYAKKNDSSIARAMAGSAIGGQAGAAVHDVLIHRYGHGKAALGRPLVVGGVLGGAALAENIPKIKRKIKKFFKKKAESSQMSLVKDIMKPPEFKGAVPMVKDPGKTTKIIKPDPPEMKFKSL